MKFAAEPALEDTTPDELLRRTPAVVRVLKVGTEENVCVPVNVCPASVLATVADVVGNVIVVPSVPASVRALLIATDFPLGTNTFNTDMVQLPVAVEVDRLVSNAVLYAPIE
jgi:hypothetical protein